MTTAQAVKIIAVEDTSERHRALLVSRRQALIIELGAIEDYLGMERSIIPRRKRSPEELARKFDRLTNGVSNRT